MSGAATAPGGDPSMEDILASIRKILNEEEAAPPPPEADSAAARQPGAEPDPAPEPLELTEAMLVATPVTDASEAVQMELPPEPAPRLEAGTVPEPEELPAPVLEPVPEPVPAQPAAPAPALALPAAEGLVAPATEAAAVALLGQLARSVAAERTAPVHRGGPTIEDVVREEVRPILKAWMDEHLPPLVERLVRAEIERVASRSLG